MSVVAIPIDYVILFFIFYFLLVNFGWFFLRFVQRRLFKMVTLSYIVQFSVFFVVVVRLVNYYVDRAKKNRQN